MSCECWVCRVVFHYPRKLNICGACYQARYVVAPNINGKPAVRRRP